MGAGTRIDVHPHEHARGPTRDSSQRGAIRRSTECNHIRKAEPASCQSIKWTLDHQHHVGNEGGLVVDTSWPLRPGVRACGVDVRQRARSASRRVGRDGLCPAVGHEPPVQRGNAAHEAERQDYALAQAVETGKGVRPVGGVLPGWVYQAELLEYVSVDAALHQQPSSRRPARVVGGQSPPTQVHVRGTVATERCPIRRDGGLERVRVSGRDRTVHLLGGVRGGVHDGHRLLPKRVHHSVCYPTSCPADVAVEATTDSRAVLEGHLQCTRVSVAAAVQRTCSTATMAAQPDCDGRTGIAKPQRRYSSHRTSVRPNLGQSAGMVTQLDAEARPRRTARSIVTISERGDLAVDLVDELDPAFVTVLLSTPSDLADALTEVTPFPWMVVGDVDTVPQALAPVLATRPIQVCWYGTAPTGWLPRHAAVFPVWRDMVRAIRARLTNQVEGLHLAPHCGVTVGGSGYCRSAYLDSLVASHPAGFALRPHIFAPAERALRSQGHPLRVAWDHARCRTTMAIVSDQGGA